MSNPSLSPPRPRRRIALRLALVVGGSALAGACSSDLNPMRDAYALAGGGQKDLKAPDFVASSRGKGAGEYLPVGVSAPVRPIRAKSAEGTKALEAELVGARGRNEALGRAAESAARAQSPAVPAQ